MMLIMMMVKFMQSALSEFDNCHHHYCQAGAHDIIGQDDICHGDASRRAPKLWVQVALHKVHFTWLGKIDAEFNVAV